MIERVCSCVLRTANAWTFDTLYCAAFVRAFVYINANCEAGVNSR